MGGARGIGGGDDGAPPLGAELTGAAPAEPPPEMPDPAAAPDAPPEGVAVAAVWLTAACAGAGELAGADEASGGGAWLVTD